MHTILKGGALAATLIAATAMMATPSEARCRGCGAAAAGFVAGAAVGAIASNSYYNGPGYGYGYGYGYADPGYAYYSGPTYYSGPGYYDSYAYAPRRTQSWSQYRDGTGTMNGYNSLSDR